jgi:hypothetical protein
MYHVPLYYRSYAYINIPMSVVCSSRPHCSFVDSMVRLHSFVVITRTPSSKVGSFYQSNSLVKQILSSEQQSLQSLVDTRTIRKSRHASSVSCVGVGSTAVAYMVAFTAQDSIDWP